MTVETISEAAHGAVDAAQRHDHLCLLYERETELLGPVMSFIQSGIAAGERCVYLNAGEEMLHRVLTNVTAVQCRGREPVTMLTREEAFLQGGGFDAERVLRLFETLCQGAARDGFKGTRIICDMGWAGREKVGYGAMTEFEAELNYFVAEHDATLLCLYDRRAFPPELVLEVVKIHEYLVIAGKVCRNPLFIAPDQYLLPTRRASELDIVLTAVELSAELQVEQGKLRRELEQAHATLAQKICEVWREEDALRRSELQLHEKNEALRDHKRRLQTILQHLPVLLASFDSRNGLVACNHEYELVTGFRAEEVMGKRIVELLDPEGGGRDEILAAHPPEGGNYRNREWPIACKDGSLRYVSWSNISSFIRIQGWSNWIMGLDVTQRVQAEKALRLLSCDLDPRGETLAPGGYPLCAGTAAGPLV